MLSAFCGPASIFSWRMASRKGSDSMSPDGAADLDDGDVDALGRVAHARFDLVGDVRDDLHRGAEVLAAPLLGDDRLVDAARW